MKIREASDDVDGTEDSTGETAAEDTDGGIKRSGVREFGSEEMAWVELALSIGMPYDSVVKAFLSKYPEYRDNTYSESELHKILRKRIKEANTSCRRMSYEKIRAKPAEIDALVSEFPVMNVYPQVAKLQEYFDKDDLRPTEMLKVIAAAQQLRDQILGLDEQGTSVNPGSVWDKPSSEVLGDLKLGGKKDVGA